MSAAEDLSASLALIPGHAFLNEQGEPEGGFVELVKLMDEFYEAGDIKIALYPFKRSINNVVIGEADFHVPLIKPDINQVDRPFDYASTCFTKVSFVLYTRATVDLDVNDLDALNIETQRGHKEYFDFDIDEVDSIDQGMKKMLSARTDGFIMEQDAVDAYIRENEIDKVRRKHFATWDSCIVISKDEKGRQVNAILSTLLSSLEKDGRFREVVANIHKPYVDWQPYHQDGH